jgi:hypothetical protein
VNEPHLLTPALADSGDVQSRLRYRLVHQSP